MISAISDLVRSGDKILKIEAVLSGTLSYLFNSFAAGKSFSEAVFEAQEKGYTEPDPRDDLNGMDVARKLLILSRESGSPFELEEIVIEKILPEICFQQDTIEDFYTELKKAEGWLEEKRAEAQNNGCVLRYIASFENGLAKVALRAIGPYHPFFHLSGNDNILAITSKNYSDNPLVIRGPGAGAAVTAGKVLTEVIQAGINQMQRRAR